MSAQSANPGPAARDLQAPSGTRDFYPVELARRRWIEDCWRKVALRHGFDEIDGPTFEKSELYAVKSGDGILNELFQTFSGKDPEQAKLAGEGRAPLALRPEFTPTLARMYAARAGQLPKPAKWFWQGPCFRAEKPQRGRLREFWQWNCDVIGLDVPPDATGDAVVASRSRMDAEVIVCCASLLASLGLTASDVKIKVGHRAMIATIIAALDTDDRPDEPSFNAFLDDLPKMSSDVTKARGAALGLSPEKLDLLFAILDRPQGLDNPHLTSLVEPTASRNIGQWRWINASTEFNVISRWVGEAGFADCISLDLRIARGLAYYTGMVFEVIVDGERAVAGGGRYDNLIELFGGPPTPACGFGMGDVVLSLVLQDKKLMPGDKEIARELGLRPDVFVISNGSPENDAALPGTLAALRKAGLHARRSYKTTGKLGKLLKDASDQDAHYAIILEDGGEVTVKDLDQNKQREGRVKLDDLRRSPREFLPATGLA